MKFAVLAGALLGLSVLAAAPAFAQNDVVVVTGSMIQSDEEYESDVGQLPYVSIRIPADFVIFTVALESGTKNMVEREKELEKTFASLAQKIGRSQGVTMEVGEPGRSAPLETAAAKEAISFGGERSHIPVVLKFAIKPGETFSAIRTRAEAFIASIEVNGRAEATTGNDQYIGVNDPAKRREELMRKIADDIRLLQGIFSGPGGAMPAMSLTGLANRVKTRPVGPLELEMFVPYNIVLGSPLPQPPPR